MRTIGKDEAAKRETEIVGDVVKCVRTVRASGTDDVRCVVNWAFDFTDVSIGERLELATRTMVISTQTQWRALSDAVRMSNSWADRTIRVRDILDAERKRGASASPSVMAERAIGKMSADEKKALLERLMSDVG